MEGIRLAGMSICVTAVAASLFSMLLPGSGMDKVVKFAIGLFFLTGVISPFLSGEFSADLSGLLPAGGREEAALSEEVESAFSSLAGRRVEAVVERALLSQGVEAKKVEVSIHIGEGGSVSIEQVRVTVKNPEEAGAAREIVERETGLIPEVASP